MSDGGNMSSKHEGGGGGGAGAGQLAPVYTGVRFPARSLSL